MLLYTVGVLAWFESRKEPADLWAVAGHGIADEPPEGYI